LVDYFRGLCAPDLVEGYLRGMADTDRVLARQIAELLELVRQYGRTPSPARSPRRTRRTPSAPSMSPTSFASSSARAANSRPAVARCAPQ
jgi:hypothetical protein